MSPSEIIDALDGPSAVARLCGCQPPSVVEWRRKPSIPRDKLVLIACEIERRLGLKRWALLPEDWHRIWPELIGTEGAPPIEPDTGPISVAAELGEV